jgi:hypothetical protein
MQLLIDVGFGVFGCVWLFLTAIWWQQTRAALAGLFFRLVGKP